jgi:two-component system, OmpR family, sensor kinase
MRLNTVRTRLLLLFFAITTSAVAFVYLYVVPQLSSSLTAERLRTLQEVGTEQASRIDEAMRRGTSQAELRRLIRSVDQQAGARVTVLAIRPGPTGPRVAFVLGDSQLERTSIVPSYPGAATAAATGRVTTAVERVGGERLGESAIPGSIGGESRWVTVLSTDLGDVDDNVALIKRQILIAGTIAILAALAAGWFVARAHSRRLRRLERAAEQVAEGDFRTRIPVDSTDEVGQLAMTFNDMKERLARLDSARREFIANASHELRTPIFSLGGFLELLEHDDPEPEARAEFVRTMREQIDRLTKLTVDLLDLSKLDADAIEINPGLVDLAEVADRIATEFGPAAEQHGSQLTVGADTATARADGDRVAQILRILIDNALTHTPKGTSITIEAQAQAGGAATLTVRDNGPGVDPQHRDRVFERFYTGDEVGGSGLGLAIARELAVRMEGRLVMASRHGRTEFTLRLPAQAPEGARA